MSKLSSLGLAAATLVVALLTATGSYAAAIDPGAHTAGMKAAPDLIKAAGLPCDLDDARLVGSGKGSDGVKTTVYEIACKSSMGYILLQKDQVPAPQAVSCLETAPAPGEKPGNLACLLPDNANPAAQIQPWINATGRNCVADKARYLGGTSDKQIYEVACHDGQGVVLLMPLTGNGPGTVDNCLAFADPSSNIKCTLTTPAQETAGIDALAASTGKCAAIKGRRYILSTEDGSDYFEVACGDGKGYVLHADKTGKLAEVITCAQASGIGGGCTLTDTKEAQTAQSGVYTALAKKAGFDCDVSKYALFPNSDSSRDVVELACSNRAEGGVGIFPAHGAPLVYDCIRSQTEGFSCSYTKPEAAYPHLTQEIKAIKRGGSSCVVSGARPLGRTGTEDLVETSCADGTPGYVLVYAMNSSAATSVDNCGAYTNAAGGGCQLPGNTPKKK